jgi:hypothetical protein
MARSISARRTIESPARAFVPGEGHQVAGLAAFDIDEAQLLAVCEPQAGAAAGGNDLSLGHCDSALPLDVAADARLLTRQHAARHSQGLTSRRRR